MNLKCLNFKKVFYSTIIFLLSIGVITIMTIFYQMGKSYAVKSISRSFKLLSEEHKQYVDFSWGEISLSVIPLQVVIKDVKVVLNQNRKFLNSMQIEPVVIDKAKIGLDYMSLLDKRLSFKVTALNVQLEVSGSLNQQAQEKHRKFKKWLLPFFSRQILSQIPVTRVILQNAKLNYQHEDRNILLKKWDIDIQATSSRIKVWSQIYHVQLADSSSVFLSLLKAQILEDQIHIHQFKIKNKKTELNIFGSVTKDTNLRLLWKTQVNGAFTRQDYNVFTRIFFPSFQNLFQGHMLFNGHLQSDSAGKLTGDISLSAKSFSIKDIFLSQVALKGRIKNSQLVLSRFSIKEKNKWDIDLKNTTVQLQKPFAFELQIKAKDSLLESLLQTVNLKKIPIKSSMNGQWICKGRLLKSESMNCDGKAWFKNFLVVSPKKQIILSIPKWSISHQGIVSFKEKTSSFVSFVQIGTQSHLNISSVLNTENFSAQYNGVLSFKDVKDLISLKPQGVVLIDKGTLSISKNFVQIQSHLDVKDLALSQFFIGSAKTDFSYSQNGILKFRKIKGQIKKSKYTGNISIDVMKNTINLFSYFPFMRLEDIQFSLKERISIPFTIEGKGTLTAYLNGPLEINQMNYNLQTQLSNILLEKEQFNSGFINIESKNGYVQTRAAELRKNQGKVIFAGTVDSTGHLLAHLKGVNLRLQESENVIHFIKSNISGIVNFDMKLEGFFLDPVVTAQISTKNVSHKSLMWKDSKINLRVRKNQIEMEGLVSDQVRVHKWIYPYNKNEKVYLLADFNHFNLREFLFSSATTTSLYHQCETKISGSVELSYLKNQFAKTSTGHLKLNQFIIKANSHKMESASVFKLNFKSGVLKIPRPLLLKSQNYFLNISQNLKNQIYISGNLKIDFFILAFPFMNILEGDIDVDLNLSPSLAQLSPRGLVQIRNGFIQISPHLAPFEEGAVNIKIDGSDVLFQSIYAKLVAGAVTGKGYLKFPSSKAVLNIDGQFQDVEFNSLPGIYTKASGKIRVFGSKFPYTLSVIADITDTVIEKEFITSQSNKMSINPRLLSLEESDQNFNPIKLDLKLNPKNPIKLENSIMKSLFTGDLSIKGTPDRPLLLGTFRSLSAGSIIFREHEFEIISSEINYYKDKPSNPRIDLRAKTVIKERVNPDNLSNNFTLNEYKVSLNVKGRGHNPMFKLSSEPGLTESEIISLLSFGSHRGVFDSQSATNISNLARYSYYHLGGMFFQQAIEKELKDTLGLVDQFLIIPHISSKNNPIATKVIVRKKVFDRLNISASRTILADHPEGDIKAEYQINKGVSVIGLWQDKPFVQSSDTQSLSSSGLAGTIGIDLEYQIDF